jgi:SAM-dependent methyltransferase
MASNNDYYEYLKKRSLLGSLYRKYWLYPTLAKRLVGRTLDIGCGIGDMLVYRNNTVGVDINPHTVAFCKARGAEAHLMPDGILPFTSNEFSSVLMDNVLEHIVQPDMLLAEVRRVLAPNGNLLMGVPGNKGWHSDPDHKIFYDARLLTATGERLGFKQIETFYMPIFASKWLDDNMRQYCIYALFQRVD